MVNILQLVKRYSGNYPLLNEMIRLNARNYRVHVCYFTGHPDNKNVLDKEAYKTHYFESESKDVKVSNFSLLHRLKALIQNENIDIINCQLPRTLPVGLMAALLANRRPKIILTIHGLGSSARWRRKVKNWMMYPFVHRIITVSEAARKDVITTNFSVAPGKVVTIQNGINLDRFCAPFVKGDLRKRLFSDIEADFWFGTIGRLSEVKNHERLILAFEKVVKQNSKSVLLITGKGHLEERLKGIVKNKGLEKNVKFLGFRTDIPELLHCLDAFIFPSLREGLPLSMLEAMASGLPVIAAEVGGIPEVFSSEKMGYLINPLEVEQISEAMLEIVSLSLQELTSMGKQSRKRALDHFQGERMSDDYEKFYDNLRVEMNR